MLGAFVLGVVAVIGWAALVAEAADLADRMRRARCAWVDPLVVSVAGHRFTLAATPRTVVDTGSRWIGGEEVSGYRAGVRNYGFCLDAIPDGPMSVRAVTIGFDAARDMASSAGLPAVDGLTLEIGEPGVFLPDAPAPVDGPADLVVFHRNEAFGWPRMVTAGVDRDGFRIGAVCRDGSAGGWLCDVSVHDTRNDLSYRFERLGVEAAGFDGHPIPTSFRSVARGMRSLTAMLNTDAVAWR